MADAIKVEGLREFQRGLKALDKDLPKALRLAFNDAADVVVQEARPRVARRSGRAASTVKARSTRTRARVVGGGNRAPYYPWLDFGGQLPSGPSRPFKPKGRYIYDAFYRNRNKFVDILERSLVKVAKDAGIEVT